ncbi:MAG: hypothetical protein RL308_31 [Bacteroidota bacterium]|jgi:type I restriction enzyme S subunit
MGSKYKPIGDYIQLVDERNKGLKVTKLVGLSISKQFIKSVANTIGTDMENYKIIRQNQFACSTMQVRRDKKMPLALYSDGEPAIISQAYPVFEIIDTSVLSPEYLMMWFTRSEFDREACFHAVGGVRGSLEWDDFCGMQLPIPTIEKQREIVQEYHTIVNRISLNERLIQKLEETAQAIYKNWFVDFEFPDENGLPYKSSGGTLVWCEELEKEIPEGWKLVGLGEYAKVKSGFAFKSSLWSEHGIPVIKIGSISNISIDFGSLGYVENNIDKANKSKASKGQVVIAMTGATIGKIGLLPEFTSTVYVNQRVGLFSNTFDESPFLYLTLVTKEVQNEILNFGGGSAQANVSSNQIEGIKILFSEMLLIEGFNRLLFSIFKRILITINSNRMLFELESLLLTKMTKFEIKKEIKV